MAFSSRVVPMPRWSAAAGCTKFGLAIIILVFIAACTAIWGSYPAFSTTLFTASSSLLAFAYYLTALSLKPSIYNKWLILTLESLLTVFWLISLVLLAGWTTDSASMPRFLDAPVFNKPVPELEYIKLSRRSILLDLNSLWLSPLQKMKREIVEASITPIKVHGQNAQAAARALAGLSTGLAGLIFILYAATFLTFALNFNKPAASSQAGSDEEAPPNASNSNSNLAAIQPISPMTPTFTQPLRVNTLPKDFEPKPQSQEHYLTPEQAAAAGIEPPTPVLRAQQAERERNNEKGKDAISLNAMLATVPSDEAKRDMK